MGLLNLAKCRSGKWKFFVSSKENILLFNWNPLQKSWNKITQKVSFYYLHCERSEQLLFQTFWEQKFKLHFLIGFRPMTEFDETFFFFQIYSKRRKNPPFCRSFVLAVGHSDDAIKWLIFSGKWLHAHAVKRPGVRALPWRCICLTIEKKFAAAELRDDDD